MSKLLAAIRLRAESTGKLPALTGDNQQLRYLDLMAAVDDLASNLRYRCIKRLALLADNSPFWVVVDLACLDAEVTLIPIPVFHDVKQIANILSQCSADALISDRALDDKELTGFLASGEKVQRLNGITSLALWLLPI
ncbi:MAG: long-chain acyl-CoA synthetase, partial [Zhongshania sp.]